MSTGKFTRHTPHIEAGKGRFVHTHTSGHLVGGCNYASKGTFCAGKCDTCDTEIAYRQRVQQINMDNGMTRAHRAIDRMMRERPRFAS